MGAPTRVAHLEHRLGTLGHNTCACTFNVVDTREWCQPNGSATAAPESQPAICPGCGRRRFVITFKEDQSGRGWSSHDRYGYAERV